MGEPNVISGKWLNTKAKGINEINKLTGSQSVIVNTEIKFTQFLTFHKIILKK